MKMLWSAEALAENWSLSDKERSLLTHRMARNRLGLAVQLKAYLFEGRFPRRASSISPTVVAYIAEQLGLPPESFADYRFESRTGKRHRTEVLRFLKLRRATTDDRRDLADWLKGQVIPFDANVKHVTQHVLRWYQKRHIAPPKDAQVNRLVRSTIRHFYDALFRSVSARLSTSTKDSIEVLVKSGWGRSDLWGPPAANPRIRFGDVKAPPGRISVDSMAREVAKLERIRALGLSSDLFEGIPARLLEQHARRTASATPWELLRHPAETFNSLVAGFCWHRQQSITDALAEFVVQIVHKIKKQAEVKIHHTFLKDVRQIHGKTRLLYQVAAAA